MIFSRRSILFGLIAAPVVVRVGLIMPVRPDAVWHSLTPPVVDVYVRDIDIPAAYDPYENDGWGINWSFVSGERA